MAHIVSPYLLRPRRDLRTACRQVRKARGLTNASCGACDLYELCLNRAADARREPARPPAFAQAVSAAMDAAMARLKRAG